MPELSEQAPPSQGADPGYYPDPLGGKWARWWDGTQWTQNVGPLVEPTAPRDVALGPPTKVCRRCAAQSQTFGAECPNCGRGYGRLAAWQIIAISIASLLLLVVGCGACAFIGVEALEEELDESAISRSQFEAVQLGTSQAEVERRLGEPVNFERSGGRDCLVYSERGDSFLGDFFELCFRKGKLVSKDSYNLGAD